MVDVLRAAGVQPIPVTITGGDQVTTAAGGLRMPKRPGRGPTGDLPSRPPAHIAGLKLAEVLCKELRDFRIRIDPQTAHDSYAAWRAGAHDDLVLAAAEAAWDADRTRARRARVTEY